MKVKDLLQVYSPIDCNIEIVNYKGYIQGTYERNEIEENILECTVVYFDVKGITIKINVGMALEEKPPLGIMPKLIWDKKRRIELIEAMGRYAAADIEVPAEWINELLTLDSEIVAAEHKRRKI